LGRSTFGGGNCCYNSDIPYKYLQEKITYIIYEGFIAKLMSMDKKGIRVCTKFTEAQNKMLK